MKIAVAAVAVAVVICGIIVAAALRQPAPVSATPPNAPTTIPPTVPPSTTSPVASSASTSTPAAAKKGLPSAVAAMQQQGFTPSDTSTWSDDRRLNVLRGTPAGASSGQLAQWFFFVDGQPVGTDVLIAHSGTGEVESVTGDTVTLRYGILRETDPLCCPSGGTQRVTYTWDGSKLNATGDPAPAASTTSPATRRPALRSYLVTSDVVLREQWGSSARALATIPAGTMVTVECTIKGEVVNGPYGPDPYWDQVTYSGQGGYITDEYVDTKGDVKDNTKIIDCDTLRD